MPRMTRCASCKTERPSSERDRLPFFEDRSAAPADTCAVCRYKKCAHEYDKTRVRPEPPVQCRHEFMPMVEGFAVDTYYCGCRGWD